MTYHEITQALANAEIENYRAEASMLICRFCGINQAELLLRHDEDFDAPELENAVIQRISHYPLQYILGYWDFCHETYRITEDTLIPRSDTEKLVELAVRLLPERARFADLCTGSGCVAISTLASRTDCRAVAVDLFPKTLEIARENAEQNGVGDRLRFLEADVLSPAFMDGLGTFDAILSNPPYIETEQLSLLDPELAFEPNAALDGGDDTIFLNDERFKGFMSEIAQTLSASPAKTGNEALCEESPGQEDVPSDESIGSDVPSEETIVAFLASLRDILQSPKKTRKLADAITQILNNNQ